MTRVEPQFQVCLAQTEADLRAAQRLRYAVFVEELGGDGTLVDHDAGIERDRFDAFCDHLLLIDRARGGAGAGADVGAARGEVVGVYRLLRGDMVCKAGQFYSQDEYDLAPLLATGRNILELGRSCLHPDYRGGAGMYHLWSGLSGYVADHGIDILFGVASFHGTDPAALAAPLSLLHHRHLAPPELRVRAQPGAYQSMNLMPEAQIDRLAAMRQVPALIKAYLRLGGFVGEGAFVDRAFNTTDICMIMDTERMNIAKKQIYTRESSR